MAGLSVILDSRSYKTQKGSEKVTKITDYLLDDLKVSCEQATCVSSGKKLAAASARYKVCLIAG